MALTTKSDGTGSANKITHQWFDDYYDLLTGSMNDQPVTLNYRPGSGTTPTLVLKGDGSGPLIKGYNTDNTTEAFHIDHSGNLALAGSATSASYTLPRARAFGGATACTQIWTMTGGTDPTSGDGLLEGDMVFSY